MDDDSLQHFIREQVSVMLMLCDLCICKSTTTWWRRFSLFAESKTELFDHQAAIVTGGGNDHDDKGNGKEEEMGEEKKEDDSEEEEVEMEDDEEEVDDDDEEEEEEEDWCTIHYTLHKSTKGWAWKVYLWDLTPFDCGLLE